MLFPLKPLPFLDLKVFIPHIPQRALGLREGYDIVIPFRAEFSIVLSHSVHIVQLWSLSVLVSIYDIVKIDRVKKVEFNKEINL